MVKKKLDYSLVSLLVVNIAIIILAIIQSWDFGLLIWMYFFQSIIIGIFALVKILNLKNYSTKGFRINGKLVEPKRETKSFTAFFFLFHYGFFHVGYVIFLLALFGFPSGKGGILLLSSLAFVLNHGFSYFYNKENDQKIKENIGSVMFKPYKRVFPMHLIIIFGSGVSSGLLTPFFLLLKTFFDVKMHKLGHNPKKNKAKIYFKKKTNFSKSQNI